MKRAEEPEAVDDYRETVLWTQHVEWKYVFTAVLRACTHQTPASPSQTKAKHREGSAAGSPTPAEQLLDVDSCWERESSF